VAGLVKLDGRVRAELRQYGKGLLVAPGRDDAADAEVPGGLQRQLT